MDASNECDDMTVQVGVESMDGDSVTSGSLNIYDLINQAGCQTESDTHPYPENATLQAGISLRD